jgi:RNA polymerase sigma-70 factor (ECF subfamily)
MRPADSFPGLMSGLRRGDPDAARQVFQRFTRRLIGLARARLGKRIDHKEDPEDVIQSVFRSFFLRQRAGEFDIGGWDSLWSILALITLRKCHNRAAYYHADRRDIDREAGPTAPWEGAANRHAIDRAPTPEEAAVLAETVEMIMRRLEPRDREILSLHLQGWDPPEIGARVGRARRTVRRVLEQIRQTLERLSAGREFV